MTYSFDNSGSKFFDFLVVIQQFGEGLNIAIVPIAEETKVESAETPGK